MIKLSADEAAKINFKKLKVSPNDLKNNCKLQGNNYNL